MSDRKKDPFLNDVAKSIIKEKISGYADNIKKEIKPTVNDLVALTQELAPDGYKEIIESFIEKTSSNNMVNHPNHYGGSENPYEAIKVIEAWNLDFLLGNSIKYISRAGKKNPEKEKEDLLKAIWYLNRRIENIEKGE